MLLKPHGAGGCSNRKTSGSRGPSAKAKPAKAKKTHNAEISEPVFATAPSANQEPAPVFEQPQAEPVAEIVKRSRNGQEKSGSR